LRAKQAKEDLEQYLLNCDRMHSTIKYRKAEQMFMDMPIWKSVHERDRREIYEDVLHQLTKKERVRFTPKLLSYTL
jgi:pre-mRNA-processing factor 40